VATEGPVLDVQRELESIFPPPPSDEILVADDESDN